MMGPIVVELGYVSYISEQQVMKHASERCYDKSTFW